MRGGLAGSRVADFTDTEGEGKCALMAGGDHFAGMGLRVVG
jgi:hypothetical protein